MNSTNNKFSYSTHLLLFYGWYRAILISWMSKYQRVVAEVVDVFEMRGRREVDGYFVLFLVSSSGRGKSLFDGLRYSLSIRMREV